jgi:two-component system cell cycle response regulator DivK
MNMNMNSDKNSKSEKAVNGKKILLAEDDKLSYTYLSTILQDEGFSVIGAIDGNEAVKMAKEITDLALILMDIKMPGKNGLEATAEIRTFNSEIPVIAQTAFALSGDKEKIIASGCTDYIAKPVNRKDLIALVNKYVGGYVK